MKTNLAIISTIAVCFLGGIQCIKVEEFRTFQQANLTKNASSATVFVTENFVSKNRFCFMMFLRDIASTEDITEKKLRSGLAYYGKPFIMSMYLLNNDVFHVHYDAIKEILKDLTEWKSTGKPKKLEGNIRTLIEKGEEYNMWYMDKGIVTERDQDDFHSGITKENSYFQTCYDLYNGLAKSSEVILNILERSLPPNKIDARIKIFRAIPLLMYRDGIYKNLLRYTNNGHYFEVDDRSVFSDDHGLPSTNPHNLLVTPYADDKEFQNLLTNVLAFYKMKIVSFVYHSITLLRDVVELDVKSFENKDEAKKTYLVITDKIMKNVNSMVLRYNRILKYNTNEKLNDYTLKPNYWTEIQDCYTKIRTKIMNEEGAKFDETDTEVFKNPWCDHETIDKLDSYPSLLKYYPKYDLINDKIVNDVSFKRLLNLQAWVVVLPTYMDAFITAIESAGYYIRTKTKQE